MRNELNADEFKIFDLIWKRTIASQMADARGRRIIITIEGEGCVFQVSGKTIDFPGYLRAYVEGSDSPDAELADQETVLPSVAVGEPLKCLDMTAKEHTTQPPSRYSEAALTKALEERGIGRPSTYASIIDTIQTRNYVFKKGGALVPTWVAFSVVQLLEEHLAGLVDYQFTAQMEDDLDAISRGERGYVEYLKAFYFGNGKPGLKPQLEHKVEQIDARGISRILIGTPEGGDPVYVRVGRYSPFVEQGERTASLPDETPPDEVTLDAALKLLEQAAQGDEPLGTCPDTDKPVYLKVGRFGPYVQRGTPEDEEKPQNASLLKGMNPADIDLATALKLLTLPRNLGDHPQQGTRRHGLQRPLRTVCEMRRRNAIAAGRFVAARRHARPSGAFAVAAQAARPRPGGREARAAQSFRRVARHEPKGATARRPLRPVRHRRRNQRFAAQGHGGRRADVRRSARLARRPSRRGPLQKEGPRKKAAKTAGCSEKVDDQTARQRRRRP